jgi:hypothetical protein
MRLTDMKISDTMDPVSDCSPTDLSLLVGTLDRIRTTGVPVMSCRRRLSDEMRQWRREDRRSGRKGR